MIQYILSKENTTFWYTRQQQKEIMYLISFERKLQT